MSRLILLRLTVLMTVVLGVNYVAWRWLFSLNWDAWWIAVPLILAETYSLIDVCLFGMTMWRAKRRPAPIAASETATVDVLITTYNEPVDLVMTTALAAKNITFPHRTWILDDGARAEMNAAAKSLDLGYITRGDEWLDRPRHAKAGNINNALEVTEGEFILILDADQIPKPEILDRALGYFADERVALVQTPQVFSNVSDGDPLGSQAPLFYGPIQQGKDGWNAAFFCGSNAILRREALMQLGISEYVRELDSSVKASLKAAARVVKKARSHPSAQTPSVAAAFSSVAESITDAQAQLKQKAPLAEVTYNLHRRVDAAAESIVSDDMAALQSDLEEIRELAVLGNQHPSSTEQQLDIQSVVTVLATRELSPFNALEAVQTVLRAIAIDRPDEAQPVMPMATISVTEDMATSMRLHGLGWKSVYHHEVLAVGLAPEDLGTALVQRLRWAQGTMQVFLRENPLLQRGLSLPQRLMYFATMWSYLSGFAALVYFAAPIVFLTAGVLPVATDAAEFFIRFIAFMVVNQLLFAVAGRGIRTWRGQQYSLALFPVWIKACTTALQNVAFGKPLGFAVTPKTLQRTTGRPLYLITRQITVMLLLVSAVVVGGIRLAFYGADPLGTGVNTFWAAYDLLVLSVLFTAVQYRGYQSEGSNAFSNRAGRGRHSDHSR